MTQDVSRQTIALASVLSASVSKQAIAYSLLPERQPVSRQSVVLSSKTLFQPVSRQSVVLVMVEGEPPTPTPTPTPTPEPVPVPAVPPRRLIVGLAAPVPAVEGVAFGPLSLATTQGIAGATFSSEVIGLTDGSSLGLLDLDNAGFLLDGGGNVVFPNAVAGTYALDLIETGQNAEARASRVSVSIVAAVAFTVVIDNPGPLEGYEAYPMKGTVRSPYARAVVSGAEPSDLEWTWTVTRAFRHSLLAGGWQADAIVPPPSLAVGVPSGLDQSRRLDFDLLPGQLFEAIIELTIVHRVTGQVFTAEWDVYLENNGRAERAPTPTPTPTPTTDPGGGGPLPPEDTTPEWEGDWLRLYDKPDHTP